MIEQLKDVILMKLKGQDVVKAGLVNKEFWRRIVSGNQFCETERDPSIASKGLSLSSLTLVVEAERSGEGGERIEGHQSKETIRDE